jgi:hypothetical protein
MDRTLPSIHSGTYIQAVYTDSAIHYVTPPPQTRPTFVEISRLSRLVLE